MGMEYWFDLREEIKMEKPKEYIRPHIFSSSPDIDGKITHFVDNDTDKPFRAYPSEAEIRADQTEEENTNSLFVDINNRKPKSDDDNADDDTN